MHAGVVDQDPPPFPCISPPISKAKTLNGTPWGKLHPHSSSQASGMGPAACSCWYLALRPAARLLLIAAALGTTFEITGGGAFVVTTPLRFTRHGLFLSNPPSPAFRPQPGSTQPGEQQCRSAAKHAKQRSRLEAAGPQNRTRGKIRQFSRLEAAAPQNGGGKGSANPAEAVTAAAQPLRRAAVTVRRAKEADYEGVAGIRGVIVPVGMSGATGFLGGKVVIDDPAEAKKRLLMAKVADLVSGETTALIALESGRVVGTIDCAIQPSVTDTTQNLQARPGAKNQAQQRDLSPERSQIFLKNLFVLPEQRRRGIARKLVEGAEEFARKERAGVLCLQVDRKNSAARDLYYSCGFEDMEPPGPVEGGMGGALLRALGMGKNFMVKEA